ncbi:hypothetical protein NDU88_006755 [Pleurodeles waltl]|uniref:Uncharacterized protein n=1 Tax=Pleurodeles waltl TaxID=8319 RepID=A0AAV7QM10_PLEWA|nr:hypothetical protein NDU88_006755 [Pleurodeles waltl]
MRGENRSPTPGSHPCCSSKDDVRRKKGATAGPAVRKMDRGPCRDLTRPRHWDAQCNKATKKKVEAAPGSS